MTVFYAAQLVGSGETARIVPNMELLALPLPWFELLATTALTPVEIARLQRVCRVLWQTLGADHVWRKFRWQFDCYV